MTKDSLDALESAWSATTQGEWEAKVEPTSYPECDDHDLPAVVRVDGKEIAWLNERYDDKLNALNQTDAHFIALAHNLTPALIADNRRLRAENEAMAAENARLQGLVDYVVNECSTWRHPLADKLLAKLGGSDAG